MNNRDLIENAAAYCDLCHGAAKDAGWWNDIKTGEPVIRNTGEILMLSVSELSEAADAWEHRAMDDKLTGRRGVEVELGDFAIRSYDTMAGLGYKDEFCDALILLDRQRVPLYNGDGGPPSYARFFGIVRHLSDAMESDRKRAPSKRFPSMPALVVNVAQAMRAAVQLGILVEANLPDAIREKVAYNRDRPDHKIENRRAEGGKVY